MATEVEVLGKRLLRGFNEEALGNTETVVVAAEAARRVGFDYGSQEQVNELQAAWEKAKKQGKIATPE